MSVRVLALLKINDDEPQALATYLERGGGLVERTGGRIVERFYVSEVVAGRSAPTMALVVKYPSRAAVMEVFESQEYQDLIPIRETAFLSYSVSIVEHEEPEHCD